MGAVNMHEVAIVTLLLLPNIFFAFKSVSGSNAGYFVFVAWMVGSVVPVIFGVWYFAFWMSAIVLVAYIFRGRLKLRDWLNGGGGGK